MSTLNSLEDSSESDRDTADILYEEINPNFDEKIGALKTDNPKDNPWQRRYIRTSSHRSPFSKKTETVLVVHGWETPQKEQPMTLIILSVRLNVLSPHFRIKSARMWFSFYEDTKNNQANEEKAEPEVVAFAPYVEQEIGEEDLEHREDTSSFSATAGVEQMANLAIDGGRETRRSFTRKHFDRGAAEFMIANDKPCGVSWYCEQNNLQKYVSIASLSLSLDPWLSKLVFIANADLMLTTSRYGIKPHFYVAVLLKRNHTSDTKKPISFSGIFDLKIEAGVLHDIIDGVRRAFRLGKSADEAVYYTGDPDSEDQVGGIENEGETIKSKVIKNNLGKYREKGELRKLLPELEPMAPRRAEQ